MSLLARLIEVGTPPDLVADVARLEARLATFTEKDEERKAKDRARKPRKSRNSAESPEIQSIQGNQAPSEPLPSSLLPREEKISEAIASGAEAPILDPTEKLWAEGPPLLKAMGVADKPSRSNVGRWISEGHDPNAILGAIYRARDHGTKDPIPLVGRILKPVTGSNGKRTNNVHEAVDFLRNPGPLYEDRMPDRRGEGAGRAAPFLLPFSRSS